jgi:hypothetical protein
MNDMVPATAATSVIETNFSGKIDIGIPLFDPFAVDRMAPQAIQVFVVVNKRTPDHS